MRRVALLFLAILCCGTPALHAAKPASSSSGTVLLAPDLSFPAPGKNRSLRSLRGQAVVLVIARNPKASGFKKQVKQFGSLYQEFASKGVVFIAAFTEPVSEGAVKSNVPFVIADNGAGVAARYGAGKFQINIIGRDGNVDYQTSQVLPAGRVRDVVQNSYAVQAEARKY